ncbi:MAG: hypothetical protein JW936_10200 [Sedimentisphaerales bacterium]|nr:hypothetical protein [Sedimentisphaerales bacterium]
MRLIAMFVGIAVILLVGVNVLYAQQEGIVVAAEDGATYTYSDDFSTPRFLADAFLSNVDAGCWSPGSISNAGPNRDRALTYRFYSDRAIADIGVSLEQRANIAAMGGNNRLYVSGNGLDWTLADESGNHGADESGWITAPLTLSCDAVARCVGSRECYLRIVLDNTSGITTGVSNLISGLNVSMSLAEADEAAAEDVDSARLAFGRAYERSNGRVVLLDGSLPTDALPTYYYQDVDGYLLRPNDFPFMSGEFRDALRLHRICTTRERMPLGLAAFIGVERPCEPLALKVIVDSDSESSRQLEVLWDDVSLGVFDVASYFSTEKELYFELPMAGEDSTHCLRMVTHDSGPVSIRSLVLTGSANPSFVEQPALPCASRPRVLGASYLPDPLPPADSQAVEGQYDNPFGANIPQMQELYERHDEFGALRVCLYNDGENLLRVKRLLLNGVAIEDHYVDFACSAWDAPGVVWYRVRPMSILPDECAEVYVRFRHRPIGDAAELRVEFVNAAPLEVSIPYSEPQTAIEYVTTDGTSQRLYAYIRRLCDEAAAPVGLALDGVELDNMTLYGGDYPGGVALLVADLAEPLRRNSYHVISVSYADGVVSAAQFRQQEFFFPRSSFLTPASLCPEMNMNFVLWQQRPLEECLRYDVYTSTYATNCFDLHERVRYVFGPDEPDAHDNRGGGYDVGLGATARTLAETGWHEVLDNYASNTSSMLVVNGTTRPLNWYVYGQLADNCCFDPYPVNWYGADHTFVYESLNLTRQACRPNRMFACIEAYGWPDEATLAAGNPRNRRGPTPDEYRQNLVQAIGAGMKGLTSWVYFAGGLGWEVNDDLRHEIARSNLMLELIEDRLLIATPLDIVTAETDLVLTGRLNDERFMKPRVFTAALLSGPDVLIVTAVNHIAPSKPEVPEIVPAENVTLTIELPEYFSTDVTAYEVTPGGFVEHAITVDCDSRIATITLDEIISGRVFVIE